AETIPGQNRCLCITTGYVAYIGDRNAGRAPAYDNRGEAHDLASSSFQREPVPRRTFGRRGKAAARASSPASARRAPRGSVTQGQTGRDWLAQERVVAISRRSGSRIAHANRDVVSPAQSCLSIAALSIIDHTAFIFRSSNS